MTVPANYQGLWRRTGIQRSNGSSDYTTQVWWFQSARYHIDLRLPIDRPSVDSRADLALLPAAQLARYAAQIGFAGTTIVSGERCEWHPEIAFPAVSAELDAGWMRFDGDDAVHETGADGSYEEDWVRMASAPMCGVRLEDTQSGAIAYLIAGERWMAWACGKHGDYFNPQAPDAGTWTEVTVLHKGGAWRIAASTLPWLENADCPAASALEPQHIAAWRPGDETAIPFAPHHTWRIAAIC